LNRRWGLAKQREDLEKKEHFGLVGIKRKMPLIVLAYGGYSHWKEGEKEE